jgi:hypothetical protein
MRKLHAPLFDKRRSVGRGWEVHGKKAVGGIRERIKERIKKRMMRVPNVPFSLHLTRARPKLRFLASTVLKS